MLHTNHGMREREREKQTDRQAGRQEDRQTEDRRTDKQTDRSSPGEETRTRVVSTQKGQDTKGGMGSETVMAPCTRRFASRTQCGPDPINC